MFKKFVLSCLVLVPLFSVGNNNASAAIIDSEPASISYGQTTTTTSRWIYVKFSDTFRLSFFLGQHPEWIVPHPK